METNQNNIQIYSALSDLLLNQDFRLAQEQFFSKNNIHFTDEDENKHVY